MKISRCRFLFLLFWVCPSVHVIVSATCIRVFSLRGNYCYSSEHTELSWVMKSIRIMPNWSIFFGWRFSGILMSVCIWARVLIWFHMAHTDWRMERWPVLNEYFEYAYYDVIKSTLWNKLMSPSCPFCLSNIGATFSKLILNKMQVLLTTLYGTL